MSRARCRRRSSSAASWARACFNCPTAASRVALRSEPFFVLQLGFELQKRLRFALQIGFGRLLPVALFLELLLLTADVFADALEASAQGGQRRLLPFQEGGTLCQLAGEGVLLLL